MDNIDKVLGKQIRATMSGTEVPVEIKRNETGVNEYEQRIAELERQLQELRSPDASGKIPTIVRLQELEIKHSEVVRQLAETQRREAGQNKAYERLLDENISLANHNDTIQRHNELLRDEIKRVAPFLAAHGFGGYAFVEAAAQPEEAKHLCPNCGDDRTGKGSLIFKDMTFCNDACYEKWAWDNVGPEEPKAHE